MSDLETSLEITGSKNLPFPRGTLRTNVTQSLRAILGLGVLSISASWLSAVAQLPSTALASLQPPVPTPHILSSLYSLPAVLKSLGL